MNEIIVKVADIRAVHFCARGARAWFKKHDLDYVNFLKDGLPISKVEAIGDALGNAVAQHARDAAEVNNGK